MGGSQHNSSTLVHAHTRLRELASSTRLPTKTFAPGEFLVRQGERAARSTSVMMIRSGECEVLLKKVSPDDELPPTPNNEHVRTTPISRGLQP